MNVPLCRNLETARVGPALFPHPSILLFLPPKHFQTPVQTHLTDAQPQSASPKHRHNPPTWRLETDHRSSFPAVEKGRRLFSFIPAVFNCFPHGVLSRYLTGRYSFL